MSDYRIDMNGQEKVFYTHSDYPIYISRGLLSSYPNYAAPSHWHDEVEFILIFSGEMKYNINGEILTLHPGEGVFVNSRQMHFGFSRQKECDFLCIILHPMLFCSSRVMNQEYVLPLTQNTGLPYLQLTKKHPLHQELLKDLEYIYRENASPAAPLKIQSAFSHIWALLFEAMPASFAPRRVPNSDLTALKQMLYFIQQSYREKIQLCHISRSGAVGQSKCCRLFREYLRQTPTEYLTAYRLNRSTELLCSTDMDIGEIALECGFGGASYYAEAFRKFFCQSPREYRAARRREK